MDMENLKADQDKDQAWTDTEEGLAYLNAKVNETAKALDELQKTRNMSSELMNKSFAPNRRPKR